MKNTAATTCWFVGGLLLLATLVEPVWAQRGEGERRGRGRQGGGEASGGEARRGGDRQGRGGEFPGERGMGGPPGMMGGPPGMMGGPPGMMGGPGMGGPGGGFGGGGFGGGPMNFMARLDTNGNGMLDPEESQGRARMFLERTGLDLSRPIPLDQVTRAFEGMRNRRMGEMGGEWGPGRDEREGGRGDNRNDEDPAAAAPLVPGFGEPDLFDPVPGFGDQGEKFAVAIEEEDRQEAQRTMRRSDTNQDGVLDADEIRSGRWSDDPLQTDRNRDGKLTLTELALRYAIRRDAREGGSNNARNPAGNRGPGGASGGNDNRTADRMGQMFGRFDRNGNGVLEGDELAMLGPDAAGYDANRDGRISREELTEGLAARFGGRGRRGDAEGGDRGQWYPRREGDDQNPSDESDGGPTRSAAAAASTRKSYRSRSAAERLAELEGLPEWFARTDADGDGQIKMSEYSTSWTDQVVADFSQFDLNRDGIVTASECVQATEDGAVQGSPSTSAESGESDGRGGRRGGMSSRSRDRDDEDADRDTRGAERAPAEATAKTEAPAAATEPPASKATEEATGAVAAGDVPQKYVKYAVSFIKRYDSNKDGVLQQDEWTKMNDDYSSADADKDGRITPVELGAALSKK